MAVVPALTDFTFMEAKNAKLFVNSPNALEGNKTDAIQQTQHSRASEAGMVDVSCTGR